MLLLVKRLFGQLLAPLPLITLLFCFGWLIRHVLRGRRLGKVLQLFAGVLFLVVSIGGLERYLYRLEQVYPTFDPVPARCAKLSGAEIVVLGQGLDPDATLPVRFRDNDAFRNRMLEAARIAQCIPKSRLLVSMAGPARLADKKTALNEYARLFNLPPNRLIMIADGVDTESEARLALKAAHATNVIVVTSASHLPRAIPLFQRAARNLPASPSSKKQSFHIIPAPSDYQVRKPRPVYSRWHLPVPRTRYCLHADRVFHETYGRIFESIRTFIESK